MYGALSRFDQTKRGIVKPDKNFEILASVMRDQWLPSLSRIIISYSNEELSLSEALRSVDEMKKFVHEYFEARNYDIRIAAEINRKLDWGLKKSRIEIEESRAEWEELKRTHAKLLGFIKKYGE